jgi:hypothetical protein
VERESEEGEERLRSRFARFSDERGEGHELHLQAKYVLKSRVRTTGTYGTGRASISRRRGRHQAYTPDRRMISVRRASHIMSNCRASFALYSAATRACGEHSMFIACSS